MLVSAFGIEKRIVMRLLVAGFLCVWVVAGCNRPDALEKQAASDVTPSETETQNPTAAIKTAGESKSIGVSEQLRKASEARNRGATNLSWRIVQDVLIADQNNGDALELAVRIQKDLGKFVEAADSAIRLADADASKLPAMMLVAFECHLRAGDYNATENDLRKALKHDPDDPQFHRYLAQLLNAQGRRIEASQHVHELIRLKDIQPIELLSLIDLRGPFQLTTFDEFVDKDDITLFSLGNLRLRYSTERNAPEQYISEIASVTRAFPDSAAAAAFRCRMLADNDRFADLRAALRNVPAATKEQPEYWYAIGRLLADEEQHSRAIRSFTESLARDPTDRESLRAMIASFVAMGDESGVLKLRERLAELDKMFRVAKDADSETALWISKTLQSQMRPWEATAWLMQTASNAGEMQRMMPELVRRHATISKWQQRATEDQLIDVRLNGFLGFKRDRWPLPKLDEGLLAVSNSTADAGEQPNAEKNAGQVASTLRMVDVAENCGIAVKFESGFPIDGGKFAPHQVNGGGLAAFDYDLDGLCDVYLVQSGGHPEQPGSSLTNQLFRLVRGERFEDVSQISGTHDRSYGQGVCVGDVNQDGFPDLLIANIGANSIYLNQGDGTFAPASDLLSDNPFEWTSSLGLADLDGDHLPDLVEINYVGDSEAYAIECDENYLECQPQAFRKAQDRALRCLDNGSYQPWRSFEKDAPTSRLGFGVVIANFDGKHGNDFFISNDGDFNHYWVSTESESADATTRYELTEAANVHGCSIGRGGRSQACMGIASGDFDRNGTLDLHVTNFRKEPVNLFLQSQAGFFVDQATDYGLSKPSFGVLGFGTQAADVDNDGWLDIAVLNGHVYDARFEGTPFQMRPQLFRGGQKNFVLQDPKIAGDYWQREAVARTLATLDWNRDGGVDYLASHLDHPLALLQNESPRQHWLQIELVGVASERDAIGAAVTIEGGGQRWSGWQIGGDGLMCSNEPVIHFGIGALEKIDRATVVWPSGQTQTVSELSVDHRYLVVEQQPETHSR